MALRATALRVHRALSLFVGALWLLQALTGLFSVFHWEIDDASVRGERRPTDFAAIARSLDALAPPSSGKRISSMWTSAGAPDRWDVQVDAVPPGRSASVRIDGAGAVLRTRADGERIADGGLADSLVNLHHNLFAGDVGRVIVGLSGLLLVSNLLLGLFMAWPRARTWARAVRPASRGNASMRLYGWHRALGLWAGVPAALAVSAGVLLAFEDRVEPLLAAPLAAPVEHPVGPSKVTLSRAVAIALSRHPAAAVSGIGFPSAEDATWSIRLKQPGEGLRAYGKTRVAVSAMDGRVTFDFDARQAAPGRWAFDHLFAFHTGEIAGFPGRLAVFAIGAWLVSMIGLGAGLWWVRRRVAGTPAERLSTQ